MTVHSRLLQSGQSGHFRILSAERKQKLSFASTVDVHYGSEKGLQKYKDIETTQKKNGEIIVYIQVYVYTHLPSFQHCN